MSNSTITPKAKKAPKKPLAERQAAFQARKDKAAIRAAYRNALAEGAITARLTFMDDDRIASREHHAETVAVSAKLADREASALKARETAEGKWNRVADAVGPQPKRTKAEKAAALKAWADSLTPEQREAAKLAGALK